MIGPARQRAAGPVRAFGLAGNYTVQMFERTFDALQKFPEKVPKLWAALTGEERDPETPISVVGASLIGGELFGQLPASGASFDVLAQAVGFRCRQISAGVERNQLFG